jgi:hypothetical protein
MTDQSPSAATATGSTPSVVDPIRYRCAACGNLTRFNVVTSRRTKAFHHYSVGGDLSIEEVEVLDESVDEVACRWCGNGNSIEVIEEDAPDAG